MLDDGACFKEGLFCVMMFYLQKKYVTGSI